MWQHRTHAVGHGPEQSDLRSSGDWWGNLKKAQAWMQDEHGQRHLCYLPGRPLGAALGLGGGGRGWGCSHGLGNVLGCGSLHAMGWLALELRRRVAAAWLQAKGVEAPAGLSSCRHSPCERWLSLPLHPCWWLLCGSVHTRVHGESCLVAMPALPHIMPAPGTGRQCSPDHAAMPSRHALRWANLDNQPLGNKGPTTLLTAGCKPVHGFHKQAPWSCAVDW